MQHFTSSPTKLFTLEPPMKKIKLIVDIIYILATHLLYYDHVIFYKLLSKHFMQSIHNDDQMKFSISDWKNYDNFIYWYAGLIRIIQWTPMPPWLDHSIFFYNLIFFQQI